MSVSPIRPTRKFTTRNRSEKSAKQGWVKRMLRLESLEQRHLMAGDVMPFHNALVATDVNGDFNISPLDALVIINRINSQGSGSLAGQVPGDTRSFVDVDNDNNLSPLDALVVINAINNGEGEPNPLVRVRYKFFSVNADGTAGTELPDPNPNDTIPEATIGTNERVILRTQMVDLRSPAQGVFSAYHEISYTNADGSAAEKLQYQWGEYNQIDLGLGVFGGTFRIQYGAEVTGPISPGLFTDPDTQLQSYDPDKTAINIQNALQALPSVGAGNVVVDALDQRTTSRFGVNFIGALAHTDVPNSLTAGPNNLVDRGGTAVTLAIGQNTADPSVGLVASVGRNHNLNNDFIDGTGGTATGVRYINGIDGRLKAPVANSPTNTITLVGGFADKSVLALQEARAFRNVVDVLFKGAAPGIINFTGDTSPIPQAGTSGNNLGIAVFGGLAQYLTASMVVLPTGILNIADRLTAITDSRTIAEDSGQTSIDVIQNDIDRFGTSRGVVAVTQPSVGGTVTFVNGSSNITFTPTADYFGPVVFTYTVRNNVTPTPDTAVGTVSITVTAVNDAPRVINSQFTVAEDPVAPLVITPAQIFTPGPVNESDQTVTLGSLGSSANGTLTLVGGSINFTPAANFFGNAVFSVTGTDNVGASTVATITVSVTPVNDAPVPFNGTLSVPEDGSLILVGPGAPTDLIANSNPGPGESSTQTVRLISILSPTSQGGIITTEGGVSTYRPPANFFGTDSFFYTISDNANPELSADGTVTINVGSVNDAPLAVNDTGESARFVVLGIAAPNPLAVMRNDSAGPLEVNDTITIVSVTTPTIGTATVNAAGTAVLFTPPTGSFNTTSTFSYTIRDAAGLTSSANVEVFIIPPVLPFALTDTASIPEDSGAFTIDVIANDFANDGAIKSLLSFTPPAAGTGSVVLDNRGTGALTDDRLIYTPPANFFGDAIFTYTMNDDKAGSQPSTATVTITVTPVNDDPAAVNRTAAGVEDEILTVQGTVITAGLSKGPGEDAQTLTVTGATIQTPNSGSVAVTNGNIVYTPAKDFNGQVLVLYTVTDNGVPAKSASATLTINVAPVNDPPVGGADPTVVTAEDTSATMTITTLLANDVSGPADEASPAPTFVALTAPINTANGGTVTQVGGTLVYAPAANYNGPDSFVYSISDGQATANVTQTVRVTEVNDAPTAATLTRNVFASVATTFNISADLASMPKGPANESGQTLRVVRIVPESITSGRTVVLNADGTITYTAPIGSTGRDTFRYEVIDNGTTNGVADPKTSIGTFNVDVLPFIPSRVHGTVYIDDNNTGELDSGELRIGGVEVSLTVPATANSPSRTLTKQTHTDGSYSFDLLPPGVYTVTYVVPVLAIDSAGANTFTRTIVAPGDVDAVYDFSILGVSPRYANLLENLASNYYASNGSMRTSGLYAAVGANGRSEWTITRDGFEGDTFQEVVLADDGQRAYVTAVRGATHSVFTATLTRQQFVAVSDPSGAKLVRILARSSDLSWQAVSLAAPPVEINARARAYLDAVDELFIQENWTQGLV